MIQSLLRLHLVTQFYIQAVLQSLLRLHQVVLQRLHHMLQ